MPISEVRLQLLKREIEERCAGMQHWLTQSDDSAIIDSLLNHDGKIEISIGPDLTNKDILKLHVDVTELESPGEKYRCSKKINKSNIRQYRDK